jgi:proline-specific peptidase
VKGNDKIKRIKRGTPMEIKEGYIEWKEYKTYYRIVNPNGKKIPLCILHGGPGSTHNSYEVFDHVAFDDDRPIIMYDQLGCGLSSLEGEHKTLWRKDVWVEELEELRKQLHLEKLHLMGRFMQTKKDVELIKSYAKELKENKNFELADKICNISDRILNEI